MDKISLFFNLRRSDIEMKYKIAEWGKWSTAEIAANLTMGPAFPEAVELPRTRHPDWAFPGRG
jgi:hypothetical protein